MKKKLLCVAMGAMLARGAAEQDPDRFFVVTGDRLGDAYSEGRAARHDCIVYSSNPHEDGTPEAIGWILGYTESQSYPPLPHSGQTTPGATLWTTCHQ